VGKTYLVQALTQSSAHHVDLGERPGITSAMAKYHATEIGRQIAQDSMDIHGGKGIVLGPSNYIGRAWQGAPISITVEGANIMTRNLIIFGQGLVRAHPFVLKELQALSEPDSVQSARLLDEVLWKHVGHFMMNALKVWKKVGMGRGPGRFKSLKDVRQAWKAIEAESHALAVAADVLLLVFGGSLKFRENISARMGDIWSSLYMMSAVLKRFEQDGAHLEDLPLVEYTMRTQMQTVHQSWRALSENMPSGVLGVFFDLITGGGSNEWTAPSDALHQALVELVVEPSPVRRRLTQQAYLEPTPHHALGQMNAWLLNAQSIKTADHAIKVAKKYGEIQSKGRTTQEEFRVWREAHEKGIINAFDWDRWIALQQERLHLIATDDFDTEELKSKTSE